MHFFGATSWKRAQCLADGICEGSEQIQLQKNDIYTIIKRGVDYVIKLCRLLWIWQNVL